MGLWFDRRFVVHLPNELTSGRPVIARAAQSLIAIPLLCWTSASRILVFCLALRLHYESRVVVRSSAGRHSINPTFFPMNFLRNKPVSPVSQIASEDSPLNEARKKVVLGSETNPKLSGGGVLAYLHAKANRMFADSNASQLPSRRWVVLLAIAAFVAIDASGYLGYVALTSSKVAGCGGGKLFNCGHVISSRWSLWMGIPVSLMAVGMYVGLAMALFVGASTKYSNGVRHVGWALVSVFALAAGMAAVWFVSLQVFVLNHLCTYCLVAHACGLIAAASVLWTRPIGSSGLKPAAMLSAAGVAVLIVGQLMTPEPKTFRIETFETPAATAPGATPSFDPPTFQAPVFDPPSFDPPAAAKEPTAEKTSAMLFSLPSLPSEVQLKSVFAVMVQPTTGFMAQVTQVQTQPATTAKPATPVVAQRTVAINGGTMQLNVAQWPLAGSKDAKYIFVEMFDYACPHCRNTHKSIKGAAEKLKAEGHDLAVITLPIPLCAACNNTIQVTDPKFTESCEIANLAVAVWRVDAAKFTEFHYWMISSEPAPTFAVAKAKAETLVDAKRLNAEIASQVPAQYVAKMVELYKLAGKSNVPKLIFPSTTVVGEFTSGDSLVEIIKKQIK